MTTSLSSISSRCGSARLSSDLSLCTTPSLSLRRRPPKLTLLRGLSSCQLGLLDECFHSVHLGVVSVESCLCWKKVETWWDQSLDSSTDWMALGVMVEVVGEVVGQNIRGDISILYCSNKGGGSGCLELLTVGHLGGTVGGRDSDGSDGSGGGNSTSGKISAFSNEGGVGGCLEC